MKIQTVKLNINPRQPIRAAGFAQQVEPLDTVRDPLYARILVLEQNGTFKPIIAALQDKFNQRPQAFSERRRNLINLNRASCGTK